MKLRSLARQFAPAVVLRGHSVPNTIKGDGNVTSESRPISDFTSIQAAGALEIQWSSGSPALRITTDQNILPHIQTGVFGRTLQITYEGSLAPTKGIKIAVASGAVDHVDMTGAVRFVAQEFTGEVLLVKATGAATVEIDGNVGDLTANLTGASRLNGRALKAKTAKVTLVGASSADIAVEEALKAAITGASSLTYSGEPASLEKNVTGAGKIRRRQ